MKRILLSVLAVLFLACVISTRADEGAATKGSFEWAMGLVENYVNVWNPDAHLSSFEVVVNEDGLLRRVYYWTLTFTNPQGDKSKTWKVDQYGDVKMSDFQSSYSTGPAIYYDNERIRHVMESVLIYLDNNYVEGQYIFKIRAEYEQTYPKRTYAMVCSFDKNLNRLFEVAVDTKTYEIIGYY